MFVLLITLTRTYASIFRCGLPGDKYTEVGVAECIFDETMS